RGAEKLAQILDVEPGLAAVDARVFAPDLPAGQAQPAFAALADDRRGVGDRFDAGRALGVADGDLEHDGQAPRSVVRPRVVAVALECAARDDAVLDRRRQTRHGGQV